MEVRLPRCSFSLPEVTKDTYFDVEYAFRNTFTDGTSESVMAREPCSP
jgi:hypothetical protein